MLSTRLVRLIETHADRLSQELIYKFLHDPHCAELHRVPLAELSARSYEIYRNLNDWLLAKKDQELAQLYAEIGERRAQQGVPFSHVLYAITATKSQLWHFLEDEGTFTKPVELFAEMELFRLLEQFFDRALYHAALGYERAARANRTAA